jgi:alpha-tubulin suppressor-like RCC1 family protein
MPSRRQRPVSFLPAAALSALLAIPALSCGSDGGDPIDPDPEPPRVVSIRLSPSALTFDALGDTARLTASVTDQYGQPMPNASILWVSGDGTIASVDQSGLVRSVKDGTTTVRAQAGLRRDTVSVEVLQEPHSLSIEAGNNQSHWTRFILRDTLKVRVMDRVGNPMRERQVTWEVLTGLGELQDSVTSTDSTGVAWNRWLLGDTVSGPQQVSAAVSDVSPVVFEATGHEPISALNAGSLAAVMLDTLRVTLVAKDSLGSPQAGIPIQFDSITGFGQIVPGPTSTDVRGELLLRWVLGPTPGAQTILAARSDLPRSIRVEAEGTGELDAWPFTAVAAGYSHTCGLLEDGKAYCWGRGDAHRLGTGDLESVSSPVEVASPLRWSSISGGFSHSCALERNGAEIHCWGQGFQAGGQAADELIPTPSPVPGGPWASLAAGDFHQCAVTANGGGFCWGVGLNGRLGNGSPDPVGDPTPISGGLAWSQLSAGRFHSCGVTTSGEAYCWGRGTEGQLGNGTRPDSLLVPTLVAGDFQWRSVTAGSFHTCGITAEGDAFCWGSGVANRLGNGTTADQTSPVKVVGNRVWADLTAGDTHSCGIDANKQLYCWGAAGLVGRGLAGASTPALLAEDDEWESVRIRYRHTCAVTSDTRTFCWGINDYGQLGIRTVTQPNVVHDLRLVFRGVIRP